MNKCIKIDKEAKKINESIFEFDFCINNNTDKKVFNKFKDRYDNNKIEYVEEDLRNKVKNQVNKAFGFTNIIFLLLIFLFILPFSNLSNGGILFSYIVVIFYVGYKTIINNYKYLFTNFLKMLLGVAILSSVLSCFEQKEDLTISTKYDFSGLIVPATNNKELLINLVNNEVYDIKDINKKLNKRKFKNILKDCSILTVDYLYEDKKAYLNDKKIMDNKDILDYKKLSNNKTIDFYCSEIKIKK